MSEDDEEALAIARCQAGEREALDLLVRRRQGEVLRLAVLLTNDQAMGEAIAQDSFLLAYRNIVQFSGDEPFLPWLLRYVILLARARRRAARPLHPPARSAAPRLSPTIPRLEAALQRLPTRRREALALWCCFSFSQETIARLVGLSPDAAGDEILDGLRSLDDQLRAPGRQNAAEDPDRPLPGEGEFAAWVRDQLRAYAGEIIPQSDLGAAVHSRLVSGLAPLDRGVQPHYGFVAFFSGVTLLVLLVAIGLQLHLAAGARATVTPTSVPAPTTPVLPTTGTGPTAMPAPTQAILTTTPLPAAIAASPTIHGVTLFLDAVTSDALRTAAQITLTLPDDRPNMIPAANAFLQDSAGQIYLSQGMNGNGARSASGTLASALLVFAPLPPADQGTTQVVALTIPALGSIAGNAPGMLGPWRVTFPLAIAPSIPLASAGTPQAHSGLTVALMAADLVQREFQFDGLGSGLRLRFRATGLPTGAPGVAAFSFATSFVSESMHSGQDGADHLRLTLPDGSVLLPGNVVPLCQGTYAPQASPPLCALVDAQGTFELDVIYPIASPPAAGTATIAWDHVTLAIGGQTQTFAGPWSFAVPVQ